MIAPEKPTAITNPLISGISSRFSLFMFFPNLNQQNREYYSLRFSEVQKELSGMKVELGAPR